MVENYKYLTPKGDSNDWLVPIAKSAKAVFSEFSRDEAIEIAGALVKGAYGAEENEIPWTIVFSSDNFGLTLERLKVILRTPDGETPTHNVKYFAPIKDLKKILSDAGAVYSFYDHAVPSLIRVAADETRDHPWYFYDDLARKNPYCVKDWEDKLTEQFGEKAVFQAIQDKNDLFDLLKQNEKIALLHKQPNLQREGEDVATFIRRSLNSLNITDIENIKTANKLLGIRFEGYKKAAYQLRNIPLFRREKD